MSDSVLFGQREDPTILFGIRVSAFVLFALSACWSFCAVFFALILAMDAGQVWRGKVHGADNLHWSLASLLGVITALGLAWVCFRAGKALYEAERWGAYVAMAFGLLLLIFTGDIVDDMYHPARQSADEYFLFPILPFTLLVGLWWCIYLNLPHVRARLSSNRSQ